jgi:hypothetical protein
VIVGALRWYRRVLAMTPQAPGFSGPMQIERENIAARMLLTYVVLKLIGNGQGTPRDLGRAKFVITPQQAIAGRPNS